ncbi:hypothetical protein ZIOFF_018694 [Zingiber officinale]|uniref:BRISC and BRCA1-A complex member 1 n=1 Tax=Zingiber officinale TaxID=94328 RepID=A0A8J5H6D4_ZINOF|nr:hypothetical protein ZIOFF_018694 [Zingiber officinale]
MRGTHSSGKSSGTCEELALMRRVFVSIGGEVGVLEEGERLRNINDAVEIERDEPAVVEGEISHWAQSRLTMAECTVVGVDDSLTSSADSCYVLKVRKDFSSEVDLLLPAVWALTAADTSYGFADITQLFRIATHEAKKSRAQSRLFRVAPNLNFVPKVKSSCFQILIYCRSSVCPQHQWPVSQKFFTMDVIYLHDKPSTENCPQKVYDALVDALEHVSEYEGFIFESGQSYSRVILKQMCMLLSHPQQRCLQDDIDFPKSLVRKSPAQVDTTVNEEGTHILIQ